jgi:putative tryptophan/tyrosine transport system substrate-binding protein
MRRCVSAVIFAILTIVAGAPNAQVPARQYRIGVLNDAWAANHPAVEGLKAGLRDLGFQEGRDVVFDVRFTKGNPKAMPAEAQTLVKSGVDVIFTSGEGATRAAKTETRKIPVVFTLVGDPVTAGVVTTLAHPGGNVTGVSSLTSELMAKRVEVLKTLYPGVKRVWFIHDATDPTGAVALAKGIDAAQRLRIGFVPIGVADAERVKDALDSVKPGDALLAPDQDGFDIGVAILEKSLASRVPAVFPSSLWIEHGGLVAYGPDYYAQGVQAAQLVAKVLGGTPPEDLPVQAADKIDLTVNLKTAGLLGLAMPRKVLLRADGIRQ